MELGAGREEVRCPEHGSPAERSHTGPAGSTPPPLTCDLEIDPHSAGLEQDPLPALSNLGGREEGRQHGRPAD